MSGTNHIILIDDDPMFKLIHSKIIETTKLYYVVKTYIDAKSALAELSKIAQSDTTGSKWLIFVDINMPEFNGWDFLESFTKLPASLINSCKVFMLSSSNDISDIEMSQTYHVVKGFISKPLTVHQVFDIYNETYSSIKY